MVQQTFDSKFSDYNVANTETGFPKHDKQQRVPLAAKKSPLQDLQNRNMVPKSGDSSKNLKEGGPVVDTLKVSGTKRTQSECLLKSSRYQSPASIVNGHLVYVRRKAEPGSGKRNISDKTTNRDESAQSRQHDVQDERIQQQPHAEDCRNCPPESLPVPKASTESLSSAKPSVSSVIGKSNIVSLPAEPNVNVTPAVSSLDHSKRSRVGQLWEERYGRLQNLLRILDQSNQEDYLQMLRSLSSVDLNRVAVELEKRSIQLSLVEAREMQRVKVLDVLGKYPRNSEATLTQQDQSQK